MAFGTYQVVSEHSILSAPMKVRDAAMKFMEEERFNSVPEWKENLEELKQFWERRPKGERHRSRRDHAPCRRRVRRDEVSEKLNEIIIDRKLWKLQQFYVNANSRKTEDSERGKNVIARETEESEKDEGIGSSSGVPLNVIAKQEGAEWNGDDQKPPSETPDGEATTDRVVSDRDMREDTSSLVTGLCEGDEMTRGSDERLRDDEHWGQPPEENAGGTTVNGGEAEERVYEVVEKKARDEGERFLSQSVKGCVESENEKEACVGWSYNGSDLKFDSLGQAQNLILTPPKLLVSTLDPFNIERSLLKVICDKKKKLVGFGWAQKKVDLTFNPMGQTHNFIITPPIFANNRRALQVVEGLNNKMDKLFNYSPLFSKILGQTRMGEEEERPPSMVTLCIEVKAMEMYATTTKVFDIIKRVFYKKNRAATTLCFRSKNSAANGAFDPGGSHSISCITGITKIYSLETTYGGLTTLTRDQFSNNFLLVNGWSILAEEAVKVNIELINPLQVSIPISGATLIDTCPASTDELSAYENALSVKTDNEVDYFRDMSSNDSLFTVSEVDFLLGGGQTIVVQLSVTPKAIEDTSAQGGTSFWWSLWFRAAVPGDTSCIIPSFSSKIWDPGRSAMVMRFKGGFICY